MVSRGLIIIEEPVVLRVGLPLKVTGVSLDVLRFGKPEGVPPSPGLFAFSFPLVGTFFSLPYLILNFLEIIHLIGEILNFITPGFKFLIRNLNWLIVSLRILLRGRNIGHLEL